ncbi:helix-turn-helix transcriptional regulator [Mycolicibacterium aubagnense]|uniref:helix-turn-helix transcriptional regulator n=1 Tax=Mycolicibacterium aubagnense TaxID=319707 RepID=UPI0010FDA5E1|nr:DNA-binding protein [Mycolicibacterium aubagnense]
MSEFEPGNVWLSREDVARRQGIPVATLAQWACQGKGPRYARFGRYARYRLADVIAWENEQFGDRGHGHDAA